jgi:medium-chain acyl-[acyl-carrier-protein] hydrolase
VSKTATSNDRLRRFCFPYAGGNSSTFRGWAEGPLAGIESCAVELPGRQGRFHEPAIDRMEELVDLLLHELAPAFDRPFALFGHSMGALIAFALTLELRRLGLPQPCHLLVSARAAPHLMRPAARLHQLPDADFLREVATFIRPVPDRKFEQELLTLMLPTLRADVTLCETYLPKVEAPLSMPIAAFGGMWDGGITRSELAAWRAHTRGAFSLWQFPGDHHFIDHASDPLRMTIGKLLGSHQRIADAAASGNHNRNRDHRGESLT